MKIRSFLLLFTEIIFLSACAQTPTPDKDGFYSLFNGQNTSEWKVSEENPNSFSVKDGMLLCKGGMAHLFYNGKVNNADFKNFELKLQVKTTTGSNSGVIFHTQYQAKNLPEYGIEAQVNSTYPDPTKSGSLHEVVNVAVYPKGKIPAIARVAKNQITTIYTDQPTTQDDEWFEYHIIVRNKTVITRINGKTIVQWTQPESWSNELRKINHGTIALQAHDPKSESVVYYKNIRIKPLK